MGATGVRARMRAHETGAGLGGRGWGIGVAGTIPFLNSNNTNLVDL